MPWCFSIRPARIAQRYLPRLQELHAKYAPQGLQLVAVYNSQDETPKDIAAHGLAAGLTFPLVWDEEQKCTQALGVDRVPQAVLLDAGKRVVYSGRIDDQYRTGGVQPQVGRHDLADAIEEMLAGKPVSVAETTIDGCKVTPWQAPKFDYQVTFHEHVEAILQKNCQNCHHEGAATPFALVTYDEAKAQGEMLAEVVRDGRMPPWYAHSEYGHFTNAPHADPRRAQAGGSLGARRHGPRRRRQGAKASRVCQNRVADRRARPGADHVQANQNPGLGLHSLQLCVFAAGICRRYVRRSD